MIGVVPDQHPQAPPQAFMLMGAAERAGIASDGGQFKFWVQDAQAGPLKAAITSDLQQQFPGMQIHVDRMDYASFGDPLAVAQLAIGGVAGLVLLLGAVGMLNISMVTVRYRVREIGIRRSFGATSRRIFLGVMMESVVATAVAGVIGVMIGVAIVKNPWIESKVAPGSPNIRPSPLRRRCSAWVPLCWSGRSRVPFRQRLRYGSRSSTPYASRGGLGRRFRAEPRVRRPLYLPTSLSRIPALGP
ncbi:ABC transporter permease [Arthrobacter sp. SA17]